MAAIAESNLKRKLLTVGPHKAELITISAIAMAGGDTLKTTLPSPAYALWLPNGTLSCGGTVVLSGQTLTLSQVLNNGNVQKHSILVMGA